MGVLQADGTDDRIKSTSLGAGLAAIAGNSVGTILYVINAPPDDAAFDGVGYLLSGTGDGTAQFGLSIDNNEDLTMDLSATRRVTSSIVSNVFMILISKPAGATVTCRAHYKQGAAGAWTHTNFDGTETFGTSATMLEFFAWQNSDFYGVGHLGIWAAWAANFDDTQAEACDNNWRTSDLYNHSVGTPLSLIEFNTSTPVDIGTSPAASLAVTGTTLDAGQTLDSWDFDGTGGAAPASLIYQPYRQTAAVYSR